MKRKRSDPNGRFDEIEDRYQRGSFDKSSALIEKLLFVLGDTSLSSTNINPSRALRQWLKTSGTLIEMLTSTSSNLRFLASSLTDSSLVHLLSAITDEVVTKNINNKSKNNNFLSLLSFIERLLMYRYSISFRNVNINLDDFNILEAWNSNFHSRTTAVREQNEKDDSTCSNNSQRKEVDDCGVNEGSKGWIISLTFMMSYDILCNRISILRHKNRKNRNDDLKQVEVEKLDVHQTTKQIVSIAAQDEVILKALRVMYILHIIDSNDYDDAGKLRQKSSLINYDTIKRGKRSLLLRIFGPHLNRIDSLVDTLHNQTISGQDKLKGCQQIDMESSEPGINSIFMNLIMEVEKSFDETATEQLNAAKVSSGDFFSSNYDIIDNQSTKDEENDTIIDLKQSSQESKQDNEPVVESNDSNDVTSSEQTDQDSPLKTPQHTVTTSMAEELRSLLLSMNINLRNQDDVEEISEKITNLIEMAGAEDGADGVFQIGSILTFSTKKENWMETLTSYSLCLDHKVKEEKFKMPLTDTLVASFYKSCINEQTSYVRASAFMQSFILPLLLDLKTQKTSFASRTLASIVLTLTKNRPKESIKTLLLPTLCGTKLLSTRRDEQKNKDEITSNIVSPSRAQCDLIGRVLKTVTLQREDITIFALGICSSITSGNKSRLAMDWTDDSLPILTSCLKKNILLPDEIIKALVGNVIQYLEDTQMSKSMKYSNLFHTIVTKYGLQIKKLELVQDLLDASSNINSFMGKTIASSLQKL